MRSDAASLRTWWLGGLGAWALAIWAATLFGLGSRIPGAGPLDELPALPALPAVAASGPMLDNAAAVARPLFASDRRPHPFLLGGQPEAGSGPLRLTGVVMAPGLQMATLTTEQGQSLRLRVGGPAQQGWQLLALQPRSATVSGPDGTLDLPLQVVGASNADAPAAASEAAPAAADMPRPAAAQPTAEQIQTLRARVQERRRQAQQNQNGSSGSQKPR